jgi:hypothetical protein
MNPVMIRIQVTRVDEDEDAEAHTRRNWWVITNERFRFAGFADCFLEIRMNE